MASPAWRRIGIGALIDLAWGWAAAAAVLTATWPAVGGDPRDLPKMGLVLALGLAVPGPLLVLAPLAWAARRRTFDRALPWVGAVLASIGPFLIASWLFEAMEEGLTVMMTSRDTWPWAAAFAVAGAVLGARARRRVSAP